MLLKFCFFIGHNHVPLLYFLHQQNMITSTLCIKFNLEYDSFFDCVRNRSDFRNLWQNIEFLHVNFFYRSTFNLNESFDIGFDLFDARNKKLLRIFWKPIPLYHVTIVSRSMKKICSTLNYFSNHHHQHIEECIIKLNTIN